MIILNTNHGAISIELDKENAPASSANFIAYARDNFYTGTIFHRVINDFMIQGGGFEPGLTQKPTGTPIENEADNGLKNDRGTLAMARTMDPHSATAQFFINLKDNDFLNHTAPNSQGWGYAVFGRVVDGMDVVDAIRSVATTSAGGHQDVPVEDVLIESVEVVDED
ncbi:MAG: peptidylprolyl isomerase [Halieaceae bacterium]